VGNSRDGCRTLILGLLAGSLCVWPGCGSRNQEPPAPPASGPSAKTAAAEQSPLSPQDTPWEPGTEADAKDYTLVTVFYGTDRDFVELSEARKDAYLGWYYATALAAGITILLALIALRFSQSRGVRVVTGGGLAVTVVLGIATTLVRLHSEKINPGEHPSYGNQRGELQMGTCQVSVPRYHEVGQVERPSILKLQFREDPRKHVVLLDVIPEPPDALFAKLKAGVDAAPRREALVFVHGFNVTFEDAARRTAQLAYDLKFEGPPIFFSWPSQGGLLDYAVDETNAAWAVPHLKDFLTAVADRSGAESVHLIAHSMGNRALTSALAQLSRQMRRRGAMFHEVILTAPDIDADIFKRDIAPAIAKTAARVTLYASSNDEALMLSKKLHGYPRAGDSGSAMVVVPGIETIDVSRVDTSLLGHSYYGNNDTVLADMFYLIHQSLPASRRERLEPRPWGGGQYWVLVPDAGLVREAAVPEPPIR
jgi:esterase/lipase superfamily enzyme